MASISGYIYLVVGLGVTLLTRLIESRVEGANITIFLWAGIVFVAIGIFKIIVGFVVGSKTRAIKERETSIREQAAGPLTCSNCGARLHAKSRYCNWCGTKVR